MNKDLGHNWSENITALMAMEDWSRYQVMEAT